jgi:hypothetical protein
MDVDLYMDNPEIDHISDQNVNNLVLISDQNVNLVLVFMDDKA